MRSTVARKCTKICKYPCDLAFVSLTQTCACVNSLSESSAVCAEEVLDMVKGPTGTQVTIVFQTHFQPQSAVTQSNTPGLTMSGNPVSRTPFAPQQSLASCTLPQGLVYQTSKEMYPLTVRACARACKCSHANHFVLCVRRTIFLELGLAVECLCFDFQSTCCLQ